MSLLSLTPLLFTLTLSLALTFYVFHRKLAAQAYCVLSTTRLQRDLRLYLNQLTRLNSSAVRLRHQREVADNALKTAEASGYPPAIAAAKANQTAVILQQTALHTRQLQILASANFRRQQFQNDFRAEASRRGYSQNQTKSYFPLALAVEPTPKNSLSPNYEPVADFSFRQQQKSHFTVNLTPPFAQALPPELLQQPSQCSVTLNSEDQQWELKIMTASAPSKPL